MKIVKVDAIDSTNTFLKEWCQQEYLEDFTVVVADSQTKGRGQMNSNWISYPGKNLTFSVLVRFDVFKVEDQFYLSKAVALALQKLLVKFLPKKIAVKWPNDILAEQKKIAGVLIENTVKKGLLAYAVIGIGLNVNQTHYEKLPDATSMKMLTAVEYNLSKLLKELLAVLKFYIDELRHGRFEPLNNAYMSSLHKYNQPAMFRSKDTEFLGKIVGVSPQGKLQIQIEDGAVLDFGLKEIQLL